MTVVMRAVQPLGLLTGICSVLLAACGGSDMGGHTAGSTTSAGNPSNAGNSNSTGTSNDTDGSTHVNFSEGATSSCAATTASARASMPTQVAYVLDRGTVDGSSSTGNACVLGYPVNDGGSVAPAIVITLPNPGNSYIGLATDSTGALYV